MSEWVFQVNPEHWSESDGTSGFLEGTACPWYSRPGWNGGHCGIFGQFQSGIASAFGLRYQRCTKDEARKALRQIAELARVAGGGDDDYQPSLEVQQYGEAPSTMPVGRNN